MKDFKDLGFVEDSVDDLGFQEDSTLKPQELAEVSKLESLLRGGSQGASMGFADEITAGAESLLTDKSYDDSLKESRASYTAAEEANPATSMAGNLGGSILGSLGLAAATGGLGNVAAGAGKAAQTVSALDKLKKVAKVGAVMGGINSAGTSEESLVNKPLELTKDVATGAAVGGVAGAALSKVGSALGTGVEKARKIGAIDDMFRSFNVGKRGYSYFRPGDMEKLETEATSAAADTVEVLQSKLGNFQKAKQAMLGQAETEGKVIDALPEFNKAKAAIEQLTTDEIRAGDKRILQSAINALPTEMDVGSLSPSKVDDIKRMFALYTKTGDKTLQSPEARKIALDMVKELDAKILNSVDDQTTVAAIDNMKKELGDEVSGYLTRAQGQGSSVKTMNKGMSDLMTTQEVLGLDDLSNKADKLKATQKLRAMVGRTASEGDGGITARQTMLETKKILQDVAPEIAEETLNKAESLADDLYLKKLAKGQIQSGIGNLFGLGNIASVGGSNVAGNMYGTAKALSTPGTTGFRVMARYAKSSGNQGLGDALEKIASTTDDNRRKAMVNTLMQTPFYRQELEKIQTKIETMMGEEDGTETK